MIRLRDERHALRQADRASSARSSATSPRRYAETEAARARLRRRAPASARRTGNRLGTDAAKLFAAPVGKEVADDAMQVLGGYGYCTEYAVERLLRDAKLLEIGGGTLEAHQKNITRDLVSSPSARALIGEPARRPHPRDARALPASPRRLVSL